jgi:hypothetical protein
MEDLQRLVPRQAMLEQILPSGHMALADLELGKRLRRSSLDRCSGWSDVRLFRHFQGVIDLDPQVSDGTFKLRTAKQESHCSQVLRPAID